MEPVRDEINPLAPAFVWTPRPKFQDRRWLHLVLLLGTLVTTTMAGTIHYTGFLLEFRSPDQLPLPVRDLILGGFWYSGTILAILGAHELGHYFACRYYDVDASLPFFLPVPLFPTGTLGAFIRIRERIATKRMLFDIGIAGPIAGFVVAVPALFIGLLMSNVVQVPPNIPTVELGEPLLFKLIARLIWGSPPDGYTINMHPVAFAAWFGFLATALNLFPIGQLDGGHISYAVLGRKSSYVTLATLGAAMTLIFFAWSWLVWSIVMIAMLYRFGPHHPPTYDEHVPLDRSRLILAVFALIMFVSCFTAAPMREIDIIGR